MTRAPQVHSRRLERFLATLYVDPEALARFLASPDAEASRAGLSEQQCVKLKEIDVAGLKLASRSFAHKRAMKKALRDPSKSGWWRRMLARIDRE
jgi:hypothetical protein